MKTNISRALLILSCVFLFSGMMGCRSDPSRGDEGSKDPSSQGAVTVSPVIRDDSETDDPPAPETVTGEPQTEENGGESNTDQSDSADSEDGSGCDTDPPKDPNQGDWDPQP